MSTHNIGFYEEIKSSLKPCFPASEGLRYQPVEPPREEMFHYDRSVPIEILRVTGADLT